MHPCTITALATFPLAVGTLLVEVSRAQFSQSPPTACADQCRGQRHVDIPDTGAQRARAQGGALLGQLDAASLAQGMVTTAGVVSHTGVGGYTLGGGFGRLNRKYGLTVDNVRSAEIITADGEVRRISADQDPDLFWAIRGGGGNFGIVTSFEFQLYEGCYHGFDGVRPKAKVSQAANEFVEGQFAKAVDGFFAEQRS